MSEDYRQIELITGTRRRRYWSTDDKLPIIEESLEPGETVSSVAAADKRGRRRSRRRQAGNSVKLACAAPRSAQCWEWPHRSVMPNRYNSKQYDRAQLFCTLTTLPARRLSNTARTHTIAKFWPHITTAY